MKSRCPRCGSAELEPSKHMKGVQMKCRNCGYEGPIPEEFF